MGTIKAMYFKNREEAISHVLKKYLKADGNMYLSQRLFIAKSIINWIFDNSKHPKVISEYMKDLEKYLNGEMELRWVNGIITKKKDKNNENKKTTKEE